MANPLERSMQQQILNKEKARNALFARKQLKELLLEYGNAKTRIAIKSSLQELILLIIKQINL